MTNPFSDLIPQDTTRAANPFADLIPAPAADTALDDGAGGKVFNANVEPWRSARATDPDTNTTAQQALNVPGAAQPAERPGLVQRLKSFGQSLLPQGNESYLHAAGRDVTGLVKGAVDPYLTLAKAGAYGVLDPFGNQGVHLPFDRPSAKDALMAVPPALAGALLPGASAEAGAIERPLVRAATKVVLDAGVGATYNPDDPALGAVVGGGLGAVHAGAAEVPSLKNAAVDMLSPGTREEARLGAIRDAATAEAQRQAAEYHARRDIYGNIKPEGPVQGPVPTLPFVQAQQDASLPTADAVSAHHDILRTIKAGWDAAEATNPFADLVPEGAAPQITAHDNTVSGDLPARTQEPAAHDAGAGTDPLQSGGLAAPTSATHAPDTGIDRTLQPALADQVEYRNAGLSLPANAGNAVKNALDRPYAELESNPQDMQVRNALLAAGAGATHGSDVATFGMAHVRAGLDPKTVQGIEAKLFADNFEMQAQSREAAGDPGAAANLRAHAELARAEAPAGIENTPAYQQYVDRYRDVMEPHYNAVAKASGLSDENFRGVMPGSVYIPLPADVETSAPENVVRSSLKRLGTKQSSAVKVATGGAGSYVLDAQHAAQTFLPERTRIAAQNDLWQAVRARGRELGGKLEQPLEGEQRIAFTDKHQLTTPESPDAAHYIALPEHVAQAMQQYVDRVNTPRSSGGLNRALTQASVIASPAIGLTHGGSIAQTVNMIPGPLGLAEAARTAASAAPFGNTLAGLASMNAVDLTDPATLKNYLAVSKYGGTRPIQPEPVGTLRRAIDTPHRNLFGKQGMDARGRAVAINRTMAANPDAHPADVAQSVGQAFGQYNRLNQPGFVYTGQRTGLTSFAPAGIGFTTEAIKRMTGQRGLLPFVKSTAAPVAGAVALNYALSGHSPMQNEPGHRGDIDLGDKTADGKERFLRGSYAYPLLNRAANTTGIRPSLEGQGASGALGGTANAALNQLGVIPRLAGALVNTQLRVAPGYNGLEPAVGPQAGESNRFLKIVQNAGAPFIGAGGDVGGFSSFSANQTLKDRLLSAAHANAIVTGKSPGVPEPNVLYQGLRDKVFAARQAIDRETTPAGKAAAMAQQMARFRDDGHTGLELQQIRMQLLKETLAPQTLTGLARQQAMRKQGFAPQTPK